MPNLLFICSKNQWRSPTAELLFKGHQLHNARSAGTSDKARIKLNQKLVDWADVIFVMEYKHRDIIRQQFDARQKKIIVLNIPDDYQFNDPQLIEILKLGLADWL
ncbi:MULTISPECIES: protein tyrosine phosphatase [unclassified Mucilaginibacter]|uniref:low molecular weight protein tyrosine phosphatase family protein n=1 Tax=unclassified Mucilaginibacter TaxID=2617802 RepID=UPI002AC8FB4F|nr:MULTISPECIES: protein tyrosine phosphatase [unclassified Mucilaginibacter]MEB0262563.1 protein tyrosine phosphatase [Mucilaginibacter sp. 10I4]MEB0278406.1 protein tyrosine phosphatase [Mucilaginibacter sp. 10B2]MEB0302235.1 protein tyrosine phosphatase [Mucilaginibacter sp. 5C4]WPX24051.1 protein tyrosine phosphatase [Mucilaginibacter sp. 5C4]